jgi:hypothetical protein
VQSDFGIGAVGALIGAAVTGFFSWLSQRSKSDTDQSLAVLDQWSKLNKGLADRLAAVEKAFADYRTQIADEFEAMRKKHADELDDMRRRHRVEMRAMREMNEGLQRMIAQNSQSTVHLLGRSPIEETDDDNSEGD